MSQRRYQEEGKNLALTYEIGAMDMLLIHARIHFYSEMRKIVIDRFALPLMWKTIIKI